MTGMEGENRFIFVDPSSKHFESNRLFDLSDTILNRDGTLLPFFRLREKVTDRGMQIHTADYLFQGQIHKIQNVKGISDYYSLGLLDNFIKVASRKLARLAAFIIIEPPVVAPKLYEALPKLTELFDRVYIHNIHGDGYSMAGVDISRLRKLYWPIAYQDVQHPFWDNQDRLRRIVAISGNHNPRFRKREQYSTRIEAMADLAKLGVVDLFGRGWDQWWSRNALWWPYWRNRQALISIYQGSCPSKFEVLSRYQFCLCFENMAMDGYITEKIFDCFYAGTIPLYLGAPDISKYIPEEIYIDCRNFSSWSAMWKAVSALSESRMMVMRQAMRDFLKSESGIRFYKSLEAIFE